MNNDDIIKNFQAALNYSITKIGYGGQRIIAGKAGISQQYISGIVSGKRFGKEDIRRAISKACGYEYEDFLKFGARLLLCEPQPGMKRIGVGTRVAYKEECQHESDSDVIEFEHKNLIQKFLNKERAKRINEKLIKIEALSESQLDRIEQEIDKILEITEGVVRDQEKKEPDARKNSTPWPGPERRKTGS